MKQNAMCYLYISIYTRTYFYTRDNEGMFTRTFYYQLNSWYLAEQLLQFFYKVNWENVNALDSIFTYLGQLP